MKDTTTTNIFDSGYFLTVLRVLMLWFNGILASQEPLPLRSIHLIVVFDNITDYLNVSPNIKYMWNTFEMKKLILDQSKCRFDWRAHLCNVLLSQHIFLFASIVKGVHYIISQYTIFIRRNSVPLDWCPN